MKKRKKKLSELQKSVSKTLIVEAILFILIIIIVGIKVATYVNPYYSISHRLKNIESSKKEDTEYYDTVAWLRVQGTSIDYPIIIQKETGYEYPVEKEDYAWITGDDGKFHNKINIMGHNIFNLSSNPKKASDDFHRFEPLMAFVYYDFANKNKYIQLSIDGKEYLYKIFSVSFMYENDIVTLPYGDNSKEQLDEQIELFKRLSIYDYDVDVNNTDDLISLFTCTRFNGYQNKDIQISGRRIRKNEKVSDYDVRPNKNYDIVDETIKKGVDNNEENKNDSV